jgi:hypothetical protein
MVTRPFRRSSPVDVYGTRAAVDSCVRHLGVEFAFELDAASLKAHAEGLEAQYVDAEREAREEQAEARAAAQLVADDFAAMAQEMISKLRPFGTGEEISDPNKSAGQVDRALAALNEAVRRKGREVHEVKKEPVPPSLVIAMNLARAEYEKREAARAARLASLKADMAELGIEV